MALFLIPHWNGAILQTVSFSATGDGQGIMLSLWMTFPVLVMSFNHYPIISPMVVRQKQRYGLALAEGKCAQIQRYGILLMTVVVLFFVLSCVLSLSPQQLAEAKAQNLSILSYLANQYDTPIIARLSPIIAFVAITKSFLGHYIGAYESLRDLILEAAAARGKTWYSPRRRGHPGVYGAYLLVRRVQEPQYPRYYRMHQRSHRGGNSAAVAYVRHS